MSRYTGPKCKLCRRERVKLFLRGARCESPKCAIVRRQQAPGQHGNPKRGLTDYGLQLREKQKAKRIYGVLERQFRRYYERAARLRGETGEYLLQQLETRLDNVLYRLGMAHSRAHARQLLRQNKVKVNDKIVNIPSFSVSVGDKIKFVDENLALYRDTTPPKWLSWNKKDKQGSIVSLPRRDEITEPISDHLIIEFYSR